MVVVGEDLVEGPDGWVSHEDIAWGYNGFEAVPAMAC